MHAGIISKLVHQREYGKIRTMQGEDAHFHKGCLWNLKFAELAEGQEVEFELQPSHKGSLAFHIRPRTKEYAE